MVKKRSRLSHAALPRQLSASLAGLRAGGALVVDSTLQKVLHPRRKPGSAAEQPTAFARREARRFVDELGKLKGTYVKIGQMLALFGEHFLPPVLTEALHELGSKTQPLPWEDVEDLFRDSLGSRYRELDIEPEAIAAASLAQVHRATLEDGRDVAVKIQYPEMRRLIPLDLATLRRVAGLVHRLQPWVDLRSLAREVTRFIELELDFHREADATERLGKILAENPDVVIPEVVRSHCGDNVIVLEFLDGIQVTRLQHAVLNRCGDICFLNNVFIIGDDGS
jgi:predicted unusual protein kinase regulating ubiquinone biosynthesis (AarF/ABC1/UbiB family)